MGKNLFFAVYAMTSTIIAATPSFAWEVISDAEFRSAGVIGQSLATAEDGLIAEGYAPGGDWRVQLAGCSPEGRFLAERAFSSDVEKETVQLKIRGTRKGGLRILRFEVTAEESLPPSNTAPLCLK